METILMGLIDKILNVARSFPLQVATNQNCCVEK